ncbi:MAG: DUF721 domain-containing protein [Salibacteraceae bacterium]
MAKYKSKYDNRKSNQETLGEVIHRMLNVYRLQSGLTEIQLKNDWKEIVGAMVATKTEDLYLKGSKLFIKLNSAAVRQELHYQKDDIMRNVNDHMKANVVSEVILR